ncbi:uncharacterized protein LOC123424662 [Hordeum vulgare subsp. vulgare]|uniref:Uncharacterized protein n=1 Tax=Hordeum vulgare subsp. vulgare TaxID=112509 RepID=A0A8I6X9N8_HORVV|nr:uncharacterized protein LOC123424662 [Hordeum vulgare subsp. vulgare]XP_044964251.1 uncharacterized protein LOC123424662 [Hordeum vulgare subsp. vulgare]XP_044964252.1 uncharacterized protein LOC123424662 [Hordeum vulgare subsp. vulgare]
MGVFAETVTALVWMVGLFPTVALAVFTVTNMAPVSLQFFPPSPAGLPSAPLPPYPVVPLPQLPSPQSPVPPSPLLLDSSIVCAPPHAVIPSPPVSAAAASLVCPASPAPLTDLTADQLKFKIASWGRLALMFLSITFILIGIVGPQVEAAAKAEARAASEEDKAYKEAKEALIEAMYAVDAATKEIDTAVDKCISDLQMRVSDLITNDHLFSLMFGINKVIARKHKVLEKVSIAKPQLGLARMKHARVYRRCFQLGICMNFATWVCAGGAFYRSIELQMGKPARADTITCFSLLAILAAGLHGYYLRLANFED